jgi:non-specific serine/threonine protein kinase
VILRYHAGTYFVQQARPQDAPRLVDLGWRRHPSGPDVWSVGNPWLAAPLWGLHDPADDATVAALGSWAWNYLTSFAKDPLAETGVDVVRAPLGKTLRPFQVAGVQRLLTRPKMMLCDDMGLGKSIQALCYLNHVRPSRTLIGCPTSLADNWAYEAERWCVDAQPVAVLDGARKNVPERGIVILPYSRGHTFERQLLAGPPIDFLIADEFHNLKDPGARRSGPWVRPGGLIERARRAVLLSGTPMPNNSAELWGPLRAVAPELLGKMTEEAFRQAYCSVIDMKVKVDTKRGPREVEVQKVVGRSREMLNAELRASGVMVRRLKSEVEEQLPERNVFFVHMRPDGPIEALVREESDLFEQLQTRILTAQDLIALKGHIAAVRRKLGVLKAPKIAEYVREIFNGGEDRVVLFMLHLEAIDILSHSFPGITVHVLTGSVDPRERFRRVEDFQRPGGRKLFLGQVFAAGEGLTATASRWAVLGEISWTPGKNDQCIDRVHRISQTRNVFAPILTFPHACEEKVIRVNARKALDARAVLDDNLMTATE